MPYRGNGRRKQGLGKDKAVCQAQCGLSKQGNDGICNAATKTGLDEASREPESNSNQPPAHEASGSSNPPRRTCIASGVRNTYGISLEKALNAAPKGSTLVSMVAPRPSMATAPKGSGCVMMPTIVDRNIASKCHACAVTPAKSIWSILVKRTEAQAGRVQETKWLCSNYKGARILNFTNSQQPLLCKIKLCDLCGLESGIPTSWRRHKPGYHSHRHSNTQVLHIRAPFKLLLQRRWCRRGADDCAGAGYCLRVLLSA